MQTPHTKWRIEFARHLAEQIITFEGISAIVIAGSVARGFADEYSDIEIPIFWERLPTDATRHAIVTALNARFLYGYDGPAQEDQLLIEGVQVDLWHVLTRHQEEILGDVLHKHHSNLSTLNALDTIRSCIPLFGQELVHRWKFLAQEYPDPLAEKIIQEHLSTFSMGELFTAAQRDNPTVFHAQLSFLQQEAFLVLLALNRRYFPTFKWIYPVLESLQVKPEDIANRFRQAYQAPYRDAIASMAVILLETLQLVEKQFPQMDTALIHRHLQYRRAKHELNERGRYLVE